MVGNCTTCLLLLTLYSASMRRQMAQAAGCGSGVRVAIRAKEVA